MATLDKRSDTLPPNETDAPAEGENSEYLPARMLNEFVYCPRLFYYEWVEGLFAHNQETVEGSLRHEAIDAQEVGMPSPEELAEGERVKARSVTLSSDRYRLIAKMDLLESVDGAVRPVDYKRGAPMDGDDGVLAAWPTDVAQLVAQAIVLRESGYRCDEAIVYYVKTKQRVKIRIDDAVLQQTLASIGAAWRAALSKRIPAPLVDSPKCPRCSLVGICLPDETTSELEDDQATVESQLTLFEIDPPRTARLTSGGHNRDKTEIRRLVPARDDLRPLYLNTQGLRVGKSGHVLKISEKDKVIQEVRINEICQLNLFGNIQLTTQAIQTLCERETPIAYFSMGGWFYGLTQGLGVKNIFMRREQFRLAEASGFCLRLARALVAGKIRNQRTMLQRNHVEPPPAALVMMKNMADDSQSAANLEQLLGIEGLAARTYFENFAGMIKVGDAGANGEGDASFNFDFRLRNRRPPRDPVNALLSLAYSLLSKDLTIICQTVGFDPFLGFYHQPRFGRASLALDLMEPFRALIADSAVLAAINTRMVTAKDFIRAGNAVALKPEGRKAFFRAYEQRMDTLVTHPLFGYRVNYRRVLEIQARLLARVLTGELAEYHVFVTR